MRHAARTDPNMVEIMTALRKCGITVEYIKLPLDCLIYNPRKNETALLEVKKGDRGLNLKQLEFVGRWGGRIYLVRSAEDAVRQVLGEDALA